MVRFSPGSPRGPPTMRIRIKDIPETGLDFEVRRLPADFLRDALDGTDADLAPGETHGSLRLHVTRVGENVFARGALDGEITVPCARCLEPARLPLAAPLRLTFVPEGELLADEDADGDVESEVVVATHDRQTVDVGAVVREALILAVPMSPVCAADCRGLCPACGQNRNLAACGCDPRPRDPRFAALKDLKV